MLVACSDLQNSSYPVIIRLLPRLKRFTRILLPFDRGAVGNEDESFAVILNPVN